MGSSAPWAATCRAALARRPSQRGAWPRAGQIAPEPGFCSTAPSGVSSTWPRSRLIHGQPHRPPILDGVYQRLRQPWGARTTDEADQKFTKQFPPGEDGDRARPTALFMDGVIDTPWGFAPRLGPGVKVVNLLAVVCRLHPIQPDVGNCRPHYGCLNPEMALPGVLFTLND